MTYHFSKLSRIRCSNDYKRVFDARRRVHSRYFILYHSTAATSYGRIGVITSRKSLRFAVARNRCKRLVRETFRQHPIRQQKIDIVLISKSSVNKASRQELASSLTKLLNNLIKKP